MQSPRIRGRADGWASAAAAMLSIGPPQKKRPPNNFWKRWKKLDAELFETDVFKEFSGLVSFVRLDGATDTVRHLLKGKLRDINNISEWGFGQYKVKEEYADYLTAQTLLLKLSAELEAVRSEIVYLYSYDRPFYWWWGLNSLFHAKLILKYPVLLKTEVVTIYLKDLDSEAFVHPDGMRRVPVWDTDGCGNVVVHDHMKSVTALYLDGSLAVSLEGLLNALEYYEKIEPLGI